MNRGPSIVLSYPTRFRFSRSLSGKIDWSKPESDSLHQNLSDLSKCEQSSINLPIIISWTLKIRRRPSQHPPLINLVFCCECGSPDLEGCYTSKALGPHLCQV